VRSTFEHGQNTVQNRRSVHSFTPGQTFEAVAFPGGKMLREVDLIFS